MWSYSMIAAIVLFLFIFWIFMGISDSDIWDLLSYLSSIILWRENPEGRVAWMNRISSRVSLIMNNFSMTLNINTSSYL